MNNRERLRDLIGGGSGFGTETEFCLRKTDRKLCRVSVPIGTTDRRKYLSERGFIYIPKGFVGFGESPDDEEENDD